MYRTAFRAGKRLYSSGLRKAIDSDFPAKSTDRAIKASLMLVRCSSSSSQKFSLSQIAPSSDAFCHRHIGPDAEEEKEMLRTLNLQVDIPQTQFRAGGIILFSVEHIFFDSHYNY